MNRDFLIGRVVTSNKIIQRRLEKGRETGDSLARFVRLDSHTTVYRRRLINLDVLDVTRESGGTPPCSRRKRFRPRRETWKRRFTPSHRDTANYSSRTVASNKSPVKWQHRRQLAQAGREDRAEKERERCGNEMSDSHGSEREREREKG